MPSLNDSLSALSEYSAQIHALSAANLSPAGQYTTALLNSLHLNPASSSSASRSKRPRPARPLPTDQAGVLSLIRDATESETRLFRFIGETEVAGIGQVKRVEKRDNSVVAGAGDVGLEGMEVAGKGRDEVEIMLRTALRLVDDYRPMPRARATITSLLDTHHTQLERVAELELQIEEATNTQANAASSVPSSPPATAQAGKGSKSATAAKVSFEDAVRAEEAALRGMEARLAPLRRARLASAQASSSRDASPDKDQRAFTASSTLPSSPPLPTHSLAHSARTPAKTPARQNITNSLVNGTTPRRARQDFGEMGGEFDRFRPLKFLGTPRARAKARPPMSALRGEIAGSPGGGEEGLVGRIIFGRRTTSGGAEESPTKRAADSAASSVEASDEPQADPAGIAHEEVQADEDQTVRYSTAPLEVDEESSADIGESQEASGEAEPTDSAAPHPELPREPEGVVCGCQVDLESVQHGVLKIKETLADILKQGLADGEAPPETAEAIITHLNRIARSDPDPPPSPSSHSTSTLSSLPSVSAPSSGLKAGPVVPQTIITAHLLLSLLRAPDGTVSINELKDHLGAIMRARGWEDDGLATGAAAGGLGTKYIYAAVGKRVVKIDRKNGARVSFA